MTTARDIMTAGVECARTTDTLVEAARKLRDLDVGALPICGEDDRLQGMVTDRDIMVRCKNLPDESVADLVEAISSAPANG